MGEKISVIVPIYNVEKYLEKCIDSIINQTYKNLEIILVDDGSTDSCSKICKEYEKIDKRIKVIYKENGGLSDARNAGLKIATGDYIGFVDSDDYIEKSMYEKMLSVFDSRIDIVECGVNYVYTNEINYGDSIGNDFRLNTEEALEELILERKLSQTVWNKLYRKICILGILFEKGKINEDEFWTYQVFSRAKNIFRLNENLYFYVQRKGSIMKEEYSIKRLDCIEGRYKRLQYINKNYKKLITIEKKIFYFCCVYHCQCILGIKDKSKSNEGYNIIKIYIKNIKFNIKDLKCMAIDEMIWILLTKISLKWTCILRNKLKIGV